MPCGYGKILAVSKNKKVIEIKQSVIYDNEIGQGFITMTVLYENTKKTPEVENFEIQPIDYMDKEKLYDYERKIVLAKLFILRQ